MTDEAERLRSWIIATTSPSIAVRTGLDRVDDALRAERQAAIHHIRERLPYPSDEVTYTQYVTRVRALLEEGA